MRAAAMKPWDTEPAAPATPALLAREVELIFECELIQLKQEKINSREGNERNVGREPVLSQNNWLPSTSSQESTVRET